MASVNSSFESLKWRVDVVLTTNEQSNLQVPRALVELKNKEPSNNMTFEMSRKQLNGVLSEFDKIQKILSARQSP